MTEFQQNLDFYLNLSHRELQSLCKTHELPAKRTHVQLAKSLTSLFKKKNAHTLSLKEIPSSLVKASFDTSPLPESISKETHNPPEEAGRGAFETGTESSNCDSYKLSTSIKEVVGADKPHCLAQSQAFNAAGGVVCPDPLHSRATEGFCCSTTGAGIGGICPLVAADAQENTRNTQVPSEQQVVAGCSKGRELLSSDGITEKAVPSFEFFVASEDGFHLYVDLNSNLLEDLDRLKGSLNICQKAQQDKSWALSNHFRSLADPNEHAKISSTGGMEVGLQNNGADSKCINCSLSPTISKNCRSEDYAPERTVVLSSTPALTSDTPIKNGGCLEGNQMLSTSSITCFKAQNQLASHVISCPGSDTVVPPNLVDASCKKETSNAPVLDTSLKPIGNTDVLRAYETKSHNPMDFLCPLTSSVGSVNIEASAFRNIPISSCDEQGLTILNGSQNKMEKSYIEIYGKDSNLCQVTMENGATELLGISGQQNMPANSSQLEGQLLPHCPTTNTQSDMQSEIYLHNQQIQHACVHRGSSVIEDVDLGGGIAEGEKESSISLTSQSPFGRGSKRSRCSEEGFPSKRKHANSENKRKKMILRSGSTPRRSRRLFQVAGKDGYAMHATHASAHKFQGCKNGCSKTTITFDSLIGLTRYLKLKKLK